MFGTSGIRGEVGDVVTCDLALAVGRALASEGYEKVVVGRDPRESGEMLSDAVSAGLRECGADVVRLGQAATPTVARSVGWQDADAGVSVTASHNPAKDNGLKLWNPSGQAFDTAQRETIAERVREEDADLRPWDGLGGQRRWEEADEYHATALDEAVDIEDDLTVVVDVGNGAGGVTAEALQRQGCTVTTLNAQPDGSFPARPSEPTEEACTRLWQTVAATDADLGIAHDGDADRMQAVTADGEFVSGDVLLALFARETASEGDLAAAPLNVSLAVDDALAEVGASLTRTKVGDVFVAERAAEPNVTFGGEESGAWIWPEEILCPDGPLAACKLAELVTERGPLADLVGEIPTYPIERTNVRTDEKEAAMERIAAEVADHYEDVTTDDGVRVETDDGWFLVRASGTQPLIRVTAEGRTELQAEELFEAASEIVEKAT
ncbi:phosphoglucosamine mutase [Halorussus halophilus]|uniref:phosphoglucosamine mutase n=1 Tax=Halorussus halophilus TaxID=2650975 RepID=UPI001301105B|nr:phosphoglucosamine mutase [Halorussus halophilus]